MCDVTFPPQILGKLLRHCTRLSAAFHRPILFRIWVLGRRLPLWSVTVVIATNDTFSHWHYSFWCSESYNSMHSFSFIFFWSWNFPFPTFQLVGSHLNLFQSKALRTVDITVLGPPWRIRHANSQSSTCL